MGHGREERITVQSGGRKSNGAGPTRQLRTLRKGDIALHIVLYTTNHTSINGRTKNSEGGDGGGKGSATCECAQMSTVLHRDQISDWATTI